MLRIRLTGGLIENYIIEKNSFRSLFPEIISVCVENKVIYPGLCSDPDECYLLMTHTDLIPFWNTNINF